MSELSIPNTADVLVRLLRGESSDEDLRLPLRALQLRGFSKLDLVVFIERIRERNAATEDDDAIDENCLRALDIVHGIASESSLVWDARHEAASLLARFLSPEMVSAAVPHAITPSDMLPPRPTFPKSASSAMSETLMSSVLRSSREFERMPSRADFFRVPRGAFSTRPAALLELPDRLAFEALVGVVEAALQHRLPSEVLWPRSRHEQPDRRATAVALSWGSEYIVKADISNFYEAIDHSLLAVFLISHADVSVLAARAVEALLTSTMGLNRGLPQGPVGSDVLATAYLLPLDRLLHERNVRFVRYADDYFFAADSVGDGKRTLLDFEVLLQEIGLSLNTTKTQVMRRRTFEIGLQHPSPPVVELKERLAQQRINELRAIEDHDQLAEILEAAGVDEDTLFALLYHQTMDLEEVVSSFSEQLLPSLLDAYRIYFREIAQALETGTGGDLASYEMLARESIAILSVVNADVEVEDVGRVVTWFPRVAPLVSSLVAGAAARGAPWSKALLLDHLQSGSRVDWVDAWLIHAVVREPRLADREVAHELQRVLRSPQYGPLSHLESIRALGAASQLTESLWRVIYESASDPLKSEMFFSAVSKPKQYPWLSGIGGVADRRRELAAKAMGVGDTQEADGTGSE